MTQTAEDNGTRPDASAPPLDAAVDGESPRDGATKKERVLHTRVPVVLERELKRFAENLRVPVSNLVRTILEDAVNVADAATENVEVRLKRAAHHLEVEREKLRKRVQSDPLEGVFAFQEVTLAQPAACAKCKKEMKRGDKAHLGLSDTPPVLPSQRVFVCDVCLPND